MGCLSDEGIGAVAVMSAPVTPYSSQVFAGPESSEEMPAEGSASRQLARTCAQPADRPSARCGSDSSTSRMEQV
jgi:hypothetical protein